MAFSSTLFDGMVIFVEVVTSGSFTQAALNSGHSTSYISKEIGKLEERLGVRLLHRTTRTLRLTPEGELYFQQCQQLIEDAQMAENSITRQQEKPKGRLKVSCPVGFALSRLRPILGKFTDLYPDITLELDLNDRKIDIVAEGFDMALRASHQLEDSSLISRRFLRSRAITIASPDYLKKYGAPLHPNELSEHKTIGYAYVKQGAVWDFVDKDNHPIAVPLQCQVITNNSFMELSLCLAGQGITRIPHFHLTDELETGKLVELFADYPKLTIDIFMVYPSRKHMSAKVRCFMDFIFEHLGE
ncbi:LysR family transcriptional regulator [Aliivibrio sp. S4TY2]|uniref:LysR family transcriptional regulator n=1 Tax=unclassified Aliivibrio TaxID=2645654 RepID=UPI0023780646|nr:MULTISPECIES: LysR family transcriptional regulator [unclassified Aliivibrio]MDD9155156.1 LysR family transcriptional regulator [Aliivibrio sp. S4TY2]MDD9159292.1 LysR family transcriptional regulator [Aliivibrio sp. S4TY1]MDD9163158.1 LysR family transcriptional regulator [Aliivibrio sp. S4MY2]MDD9167291.1 LysR family transcriptional regulator [Aliivibrio sp. S4MY4]MDD9184235.1 LysR family transcriptional regulator [Aliivibrio sp. S4MY3]